MTTDGARGAPAPRKRDRPAEASAPLAKAKVLVAFARAKAPSAGQLLRGAEFPLRAPTVPSGVQPPKPTPRTGVHYDTDWARTPTARAARRALVAGVMRPLSTAIADPELAGTDRLDNLDGPVIFAANHHSHLDTPLLLSSLPARFRNKVFAAAAADYFFGNRVTGAASALALNAIPLERTKINRSSAEQAADLLDEGWSMLIFPEGGRSPDGWGQPFKGGAAYLAVRCGVPVVPVHIRGTDRLFPKGAKRPRRGSTLITFGKPLRPGPDDDSRHFGPVIEAAVAALGDEATTDWYSARRRAHASQTPPLTGPDDQSWLRSWDLGDRKPLHRGKRTRAERQWP